MDAKKNIQDHTAQPPTSPQPNHDTRVLHTHVDETPYHRGALLDGRAGAPLFENTYNIDVALAVGCTSTCMRRIAVLRIGWVPPGGAVVVAVPAPWALNHHTNARLLGVGHSRSLSKIDRFSFLILITAPKIPNLSLKPSCHPQHDTRDAVLKYAIAL